MLGKLMKYEWRGLRLPILIMVSILGGITVLTCAIIFLINPKLDDVATGFSIISLITCVLLYYFGIIGCTIGTMLIIAIRFYKTSYTDQGYLTHTLPVETKTLLTAKTITSVLCYLLMLLGVVVTIFVIIGAAYIHIVDISEYDRSMVNRQIAETINDFSVYFREEYGISLGVFVTFYVLFLIVGCISAIMTVLGCISLGQLYTKHRIIGAILAYLAVMSIQQLISYISILPTYSRMLRAEYLSESIPMLSVISPTMIITLIWCVAVSIAMHFINLHMMTKRLNLE